MTCSALRVVPMTEYLADNAGKDCVRMASLRLSRSRDEGEGAVMASINTTSPPLLTKI